MNNKTYIASAVAAILIIVLAVWLIARSGSNPSPVPTGTSSTTTTTTGTVTPPAPTSNESAYGDPGGRFSFNYPSAFSVTGPKSGLTTLWRANATTTGSLLATLSVPRSYLPNTNFSDARLTVGESTNKAELGASGCPSSPAGYAPGTATAVTINGQTFTKLLSSDAAAGNRYDTTGYYTIRNGECWAIEYTIHYGVFQNYDPSTGVTEFNESQVAAMLDKIVASFTFVIPQ